MRVGDPILGSREFDSRTFFGEFRYDSVNDVNFPREGGTFALGWQAEREGKGTLTDANADLLVYDQLYAHSWGRNTGIMWGSAGLRTDNDVDVVRAFFSLGGFLNMSGITPETLVGPNYAILRAIYYRQIGVGGTGFLDVPVYIGASLEQGNVWNRRQDISFASSKTNGSVFLGTGHHSRPGLLRAGHERRRRLGVLPVPRPDFLVLRAHDGKRRRSDGVREFIKKKRGSEPAATRAASRPCRT